MPLPAHRDQGLNLKFGPFPGLRRLHREPDDLRKTMMGSNLGEQEANLANRSNAIF
jgi:hypothetical protein